MHFSFLLMSITYTISSFSEGYTFRSRNRGYGGRDPPRWPRDTPLTLKVGTNFADKRR
jgi:hypothetical protein